MGHTECENSSVMEAIGPSLESLAVVYTAPDEEGDDDGFAAHPVPFDDSAEGVFRAMHGNCTSLRKLRMGAFKVSLSLVSLIDNNKHLDEVDLAHCSGLNSAIVRKLAEAPCMETIDLSYTVFEDRGLSDFGVGPGITSLLAWNTNLDGERCVKLCNAFANLTDLKLSLPGTNADLVQIAHSCVHLQKAEFQVSHTITDNEMSEVAACWKDIRWLYLGHFNSLEEVCSEHAVVALLRACPTLKRFKNCINDPSTSWRDADMPFSVDACHYDVKNTLIRDEPRLRGQYQLTHLFVDSLSEHGLTTVLSMCPHLHTLAIRHRVDYAPVASAEYTVHTRPAEFALHHINNSSVRTLHLVDCSTLSNAHISVLNALTELIICNTGAGLTNSGVVTTASACDNLTSLTLCRCIGLTCAVVVPILKKCASLTTFHFYTEHAQWVTNRKETVEKQVLYEMVKDMYPHVKEFSLT